MRGNDRIILVALPVLALVAAFWFLLISPQRQESSDLQEEIDTARGALEAAQSQIAAAEQARDAFPKNYGVVVKLGRAVPEDGDQATFIYDMSKLGDRNELDFRTFNVVGGTGEAVPAPAAPTPTPNAAAASEQRVDTAVADTGAAPATEASAALLPLGASIGPAGLPVTPYEMVYLGDFFRVADFLRDLDETVRTEGGVPVVHGRLVTVDGFSLSADPIKGFPSVEANFALTTYIVPPEQGITGGATPAGPAPASAGTPTPASTSTTATPTPTASTTP